MRKIVAICCMVLVGFAKCEKIIIPCECSGTYYGSVELKLSESKTKKVCCDKSLLIEYVGNISSNPLIINIRIDGIDAELEDGQFKRIGEYLLMFTTYAVNKISVYYETKI
jgi:hypothetical protein